MHPDIDSPFSYSKLLNVRKKKHLKASKHGSQMQKKSYKTMSSNLMYKANVKLIQRM